MSASVDLTAPKLGSGTRFRKLSATLAARGATDPDALAAFIGRKRYGPAGMAKLSGGASLANPDLGIYLAADDSDDDDDDSDDSDTLTCPSCKYSAPSSAFGPSGASQDKQPSALKTPQPSTASSRKGAAVSVKSGKAANSLSNGTRDAITLAAGTLTARRHAIGGPADVLVARANDGTAILRHRHGGAEIASLRRTEDGKRWIAKVNGKDLAPRDHQRTALIEAVGHWNKAVTGSLARADAPLQPPPQQTELMQEYGIPAIRALATPTTSSAGGPRVTASAAGSDDDDDDGTDDGELTPRGKTIKKKLIAKGFPVARAHTFAKMSQKTKPGAFGKSAVAS